MRIAAYARYSSEKQKQESIEDQFTAIRAWADKLGHEVVAYYSDPARSGKSIKKRPGLMKLLKDAASTPRSFDEVVVYHLSRLSRRVKQTLHISDLLKAGGVELTSITDNVTTRDPNAFMNLVIHAMTNEKANKDMVIHMQKGVDRQFNLGFTIGKLPFGYEAAPVYKPSNSNGARVLLGLKPQIVASEAEIIVKAFHMYAEGEALYEIVRMMNRECAPYRSWSKSGVENMLKNPIYIGVRFRNRTTKVTNPATEDVVCKRIEDETQWAKHEDEGLRIIDQATWERAEQRRASRPTGTKRETPAIKLLTGLLVCGDPTCNSRYTSSARDYYVCPHRYTAKCTNEASFRQAAIEGLVLPALGHYLLPWVDRLAAAAVERSQTGKHDIKPLRQELKRLQEEADRLLGSVQRGILTGSALDTCLNRYQGLCDEIGKQQAKIQLIESEQNIGEVKYDRIVAEQFLANLPDALRADVSEGRRFLGSIIEKIAVTDTQEPRKCPYCRELLEKITPRHLKKHGLTIGTYLKECPSLGFTRSATITVHLKEDGILREGKVFGLHTSMKRSALSEHLQPLIIQLDGSTSSDTQPEIGAIVAAEQSSEEAA